jgi:hypothetical protein
MVKKILGLALTGLIFPWLLFGADRRANPIDMYLIFDGSAALRNGRDGAVNWLCDTLIDGLIQEGDTLYIWLAGGTAELVFSGTVNGTEQKEAAKTKIRSLSTQSGRADYAGALRDAAARKAAAGNRQIAYTLLISGPANGTSGISAAQEADLTGLLRYSRVEDFPEWRVLTVAPGIGPQVQRAAAAYMSAERTAGRIQ